MIGVARLMLCLFGLRTFTHGQIYPATYSYDNSLQSMATPGNGSSPSRYCINSNVNGGRLTCQSPQLSSILFDGITPCLCGTTWASQLLTLTTNEQFIDITFDFTTTSSYVGIERMEISLFNCPQWGMGITSVTATSGQAPLVVLNTHAAVSCNSLITACTDEISTTSSTFTLRFQLTQGSNSLHAAEITFYSLNQPSRSCHVSKQSCAPFGMDVIASNKTKPSFSTASDQVPTSHFIDYSKETTEPENTEPETTELENTEPETTESELTVTSSPNCSPLLLHYIVLAMAIFFSCLVTSIVSVPLTALVTRKCYTATSGIIATDITSADILELKEQSANGNEVQNHIYAAVGIGTAGGVEVTQNEAYAVLS